ncbi:superoxide-generating NADPH oxidase heavy chain subunit A [Rhypophila decipiens]|uniref:Superoxide-generating NADPH oxidase heavy chain subunit A n=1 Tax=Rhypophila decipiens TaxID=261697 RepID=A0AAN6Y8Y7_9PEZI|nr:superoxide-generating NADPH oxidase heavy chain subunit A [Rhypophila decipiens]
MQPLHFKFVPVVNDQHTAARAYFLCVIGMLLVESMIRLLPALAHLLSRRKHAGNSTYEPHPRNHWTISVWIHKLLTLPSPIPFITDHTVASLIRCLIFTGLNVLWGWNRIRYTTDYQLYGWLTIANAGLTLLLPTRTNLLSIVARIPSPVLLMYHRWAGTATLVHATLHFSLTAQHYIRTEQFDTVLENARIRVGILGWAVLAVMFLTSIRILRRRTFELFYYTHFLFLVFVAAAFYHAAYTSEFILPGLILWAVDRLVRFAYNFRAIKLTSVTHYSAGQVTKLKFEGMKTTSPGQIAWLQIPGISALNWHPFTIASAPGKQKTGTIAIRSLGGYTKKVMNLAVEATAAGADRTELAASAASLKIRLDGPYGVGRLCYSQFPVVVLVAGGIGITPAMSIASHIVNVHAEAEKSSSSKYHQHIHLLWTIKDARHLAWFEDELTSLASQSKGLLLLTIDIDIYITGGGLQEENELEGGPGGIYKYQGPGPVHKGRRPNLTEWFKSIKETRPGLDAAVNLCGPRALTRAGRHAAARTSSRDGLFFVEEEEFEF